MPVEKIKSFDAINIDTSTANAFISEGSPLRHELKALVQGKKMVMTETAKKEFLNAVKGSAGVKEQARALRFLKKVKIIKDNPSTRIMGLSKTKKIGLNDQIIFGTADNLHILTLTSDKKFVVGAAFQNINFGVIIHRAVKLMRL